MCSGGKSVSLRATGVKEFDERVRHTCDPTIDEGKGPHLLVKDDFLVFRQQQIRVTMIKPKLKCYSDVVVLVTPHCQTHDSQNYLQQSTPTSSGPRTRTGRQRFRK